MIHNAAKRPVQAPSEMWWVIAAIISPLFNRIAITFTKIQARNSSNKKCDLAAATRNVKIGH